MERVRGRRDGGVRTGPGFTLTLSEMDQALFRLPGLLDYRAEVSRARDGKFRLHLEVQRSEGGSPTDLEVIRMLDEVDAIRRGIAESSLETPTVRFSAGGRWTTTGVSKRRDCLLFNSGRVQSPSAEKRTVGISRFPLTMAFRIASILSRH